MGHIKAAQSLEEACLKFFPEVEVKNEDILDYTNFFIKFLYNDLYVWVNKYIPELYAYVYKHYSLAVKVSQPRLFLDKLNFGRFFKLVDDFNPDIIIATHFTPASVLANYRKAEKNYKIVVVVTDYEAHPMWTVEKADLNIVASGNVKQSLIFYGIKEEKISVIGIPIPPKTAKKKNVKALKIKYGLVENSPVVLFSSGSFGFMPLTQIIDGLNKAIKKDFQMMVVCGKNSQLKEELERRMIIEPRLKKIFGFVDYMDELMAVSDILVTKPGGITTSEALALGLPMILTDPVPGQEEANAYYLTENGAAREVRSLPDLFYELNYLLESPKKLAQLSKNCKAISEPDSAKKIIEKAIKTF
jgi:processive 1,2-diacylglycerol beta-glucosyltransferase